MGLLSVILLLLIVVYLHWGKIGGLALKGLALLNITLCCLFGYTFWSILFESSATLFSVGDGVLGWISFCTSGWLVLTTILVTAHLSLSKEEEPSPIDYTQIE
jgi:hypothetical protein